MATSNETVQKEGAKILRPTSILELLYISSNGDHDATFLIILIIDHSPFARQHIMHTFSNEPCQIVFELYYLYYHLLCAIISKNKS